MILIEPSQRPHCEGFIEDMTLSKGVAGGVIVNGPIAGVTHAPPDDEIVATTAIVSFLRSKFYDIDNLIASGVAVDKTENV